MSETTMKCPKCSEQATHVEPLVLNGQRKAWCPNAHSFPVPAPTEREPSAEETLERAFNEDSAASLERKTRARLTASAAPSEPRYAGDPAELPFDGPASCEGGTCGECLPCQRAAPPPVSERAQEEERIRRAAFEEGYIQGAHHGKFAPGRSVIAESRRIADAYLARLRAPAPGEEPT